MKLARGEADGVNVVRHDGPSEYRDGFALTARQSQELFARSGAIVGVEWTIGPDRTSR
jgi:hypothetical protein